MKKRIKKQDLKPLTRQAKKKLLATRRHLDANPTDTAALRYVWSVDWNGNAPIVSAYVPIRSVPGAFKLMRQYAIGSYWIRDGKWNSSAENDGVFNVQIWHKSFERAFVEEAMDIDCKLTETYENSDHGIFWQRIHVQRANRLVDLYKKTRDRLAKKGVNAL